MTDRSCEHHTVRVKLPGRGEFAFLPGPDGAGPLAPLHHIDETGVPTPGAVFVPEDSYAHVFEDGTIRRYGEAVGTRDDLIVTGTCPRCGGDGKSGSHNNGGQS